VCPHPYVLLMLKKLHLHDFKSFRDSVLDLGPFSLVVGTNASGKSNVRDAFRFLHGIGRGYGLAEIFGSKYIDRVIQWTGIRGGTREAAFMGKSSFQLDIELDGGLIYSIGVGTESSQQGPRLLSETLRDAEGALFEAYADDDQVVTVTIKAGGNYRKGHSERFAANKPILTQIRRRLEEKERTDSSAKRIVQAAERAIVSLSSMQFLDLSPEAMREPSQPGQNELGDHGENLSSVLQAICQDPNQKAALIEWVQALTPMDAVDLEFPLDLTGSTLVTLVERSGRRISAHSASDGTLRFLAVIAALLGPYPAQFYLFEELENGIHPARLYLLLQLIEQKISAGSIQIVATTHSPQLLGLLGPRSLEHASLIYRLEHHDEARIKRIVDMPDARRIIEAHGLADLLASGWMEDTMEFGSDEEER